MLALNSDVLLVAREQLDGHYHAARAWFVNRNHYAAFLNLTSIASFAYLIKVHIESKRNTNAWLVA